MDWGIERMEWEVEGKVREEWMRGKSGRCGRKVERIERMVVGIVWIWKGKRKKVWEKGKGRGEVMREVCLEFRVMMDMVGEK